MRLLSFIMTLLLTAACGTDPEPRLYGAWFEPVTGEKVQLNEDGSLEWFGEIGTFEFARNSNAFCNIARNGCADGEVVFRLPSGSFRLTYRKQQFTSSPGIWASVLRTYGVHWESTNTTAQHSISSSSFARTTRHCPTVWTASNL